MAKRSGAGGILLAAIILGLLTAYLFVTQIRKYKEGAEADWVKVVTATKEIKPNTTITRDMITIERVPPNIRADNSVERLEDVEGRIAISRIRFKDQVRDGDLLKKGQTPTLALEIPVGKRAVAIKADEVSAVGASVKPGDRVDVLATYHDPVTKQDTTQMILQNVPVLAVNQGETQGANTQGAKSSMTLAVLPEEVELLTAADRAGVLRVSLRGMNDDKIINSPGITVRDLGPGNKFFEPIVAQQQQASTSGKEPTATPIIISPPPSRQKPEITVIRGVEEKVITP
jgi:pilus assembly protein CpaB